MRFLFVLSGEGGRNSLGMYMMTLGFLRFACRKYGQARKYEHFLFIANAVLNPPVL